MVKLIFPLAPERRPDFDNRLSSIPQTGEARSRELFILAINIIRICYAQSVVSWILADEVSGDPILASAVADLLKVFEKLANTPGSSGTGDKAAGIIGYYIAAKTAETSVGLV